MNATLDRFILLSASVRERVDRRELPIGVQLVGGRWGDERLLAIAGAISEVAGGFQHPPDFCAV